jgi:AcrR family transcriptional regulator
VTGRDDIETWLELADVRLDHLIAALRYRVYRLQDAPQAADGLSSTRSRGRAGALPPDPPISLEPLFRRMPKRADSTETLEKLLDATLELLDRHDLDDMRLADVEQHTGVTRGVIYHYFKGKHDLAWAAIGRRLDALLVRISQLGSDPADPEGKLRAIISTLVEAYERDPGLIRTVYHMENGGPESVRLREYRNALARAVGAILYGVMAERDRAPALANVLAYLLLATVDRVCYDLYVVPFRELKETLRTKGDLVALLTFIFTRMYLQRDPAVSGAQPAIQALLAMTRSPQPEAARRAH